MIFVYGFSVMVNQMMMIVVAYAKWDWDEDDDDQPEVDQIHHQLILNLNSLN